MKKRQPSGPDPFLGLHFLASIILLCTAMMPGDPRFDIFSDLSLLEKYGAVSLSLVVFHGFQHYLLSIVDFIIALWDFFRGN